MIRRVLSLSVLAAATACGSVPTKKFEFRVIDAAETPRPCLIVVNDDWETAVEKNQYVNAEGNNALVLEIAFPVGEVDVTAAPVLVEGNKVVRPPKSAKDATDHSGFKVEVRPLRLTSPRVHLFALERKSIGT